MRKIPRHPLLPLCLLFVSLGRAEKVEMRTFSYRTEIRVSAYARVAETITNPLNWPHVRYVVPDGSFVAKDTVIVEFDREELEYNLADANREAAAVEAELRRKVTELTNAETALRDSLTGIRDQLEVLETQLARLRALPEPDDVAIAEGRLNVAVLAADAAEKDLETAQDRLRRGMISQAELDVFDRACREARARLKHSRETLALVSEGAWPSSIRKVELRIANLRLEIERTERQLEENRQVSEIERRAAQARAGLIANRIAELERDLENTRILAPIEGHVVYMPIFRQRLANTGDRMWKGFSFMKMPNPETLAFKGVLPESERRFFAPGDRAAIRVSSNPEKELVGKIVSFSELPHDRGETEGQEAPQQADSGVMVYDVVVEVDALPEWVQVGTTGQCELVSLRPEEHPAVPATLAKYEDGTFYLAFDGVYRPVDGRIVDGFLVLADRDLAGREVSLFGQMPTQARADEHRTEKTGRFTVSAELRPADTAEVVVGRIHNWQKIASIVPEDEWVEKDRVVAQLDTADTKEEIRRREGELQRLVSLREKEEETAKLRERQNRFSLERARNLLEIAALDHAELLENRMTATRLNARLNAELAGIRLEFLTRERDRVEDGNATSRSPVEIARLRRNCARAELQKEASEIRLAKLERGAEELALARAEQTKTDRELTVITEIRKGETDEARFGYLLRQAESEERRARDRVEEMRESLANLTLKAPRSGLVQYNKVWQGGVWAKVTVGSQVGQRVAVMEIADVSRMYMRAELPEKYFEQVREGGEVDVAIPALSDAVLKGKVSEVEFLFHRKRRKDSEAGLYSGHEALGETVFYVRVELDEQQGVKLKPGAMGEIIFPFEP